MRDQSGCLIVSPESSKIGRALLIHGYGQSRFEALPLASRLAIGGWEIIVPDLPGHGDSPYGLLSYTTLWESACAWKREFSPEILIGHSLGARAVLALGGTSRIVALSPPMDSRFDETNRAELLAHLRPRWVHEERPMAGLTDALDRLPIDAPGVETALVLLAQRDLSSVEVAAKNWGARQGWTCERIRFTDHSSLPVSAQAAERILSWIQT